MINLKEYHQYWERMVERIDGVSDEMGVTVDKDMARRIQSLQKGTLTLFWIPPSADSKTRNADAYKEENECVIFVMEKYDPQRRDAMAVLEDTQRVIEEIKMAIIDDQCMGCQMMRVDAYSLTTMPETDFFAGFAGWSLGFKAVK